MEISTRARMILNFIEEALEDFADELAHEHEQVTVAFHFSVH